jgi:hypothetical protein
MRGDIRRRLMTAARTGEVIYYMELGLPRGRILGQTLGEISECEHNQGRPLLSAIAVSKVKGMPNPGFWDLPSVPRGLTERQRPIFWARELARLLDWWQAHPLQE